jgi:hypothetical protein
LVRAASGRASRVKPGRAATGAALGVAALAAALALASCGGKVPNPLSRERVVREERQTLADGETALFTLDAGKYRAEVTARGDPVSVEWRGADCPASGETSSYIGTCELVTQGQLLVRNPHGAAGPGRVAVASGGPAEIAVKVTKLPL